jgi:hypothetical protein
MVTSDKEIFTCDECGNDEFNYLDGRPYKYEPSRWICEDCEQHLMEEDDE